ncbi:MAG TPA: hypothetical protein VH328_03310 [Burkholderiaceae bacterium]|nr:hypothetical protein [Burkholderiaceae bacterium]
MELDLEARFVTYGVPALSLIRKAWMCCAVGAGMFAIPASAQEYTLVKLGVAKGYTSAINAGGEISLSLKIGDDEDAPAVYRDGKIIQLAPYGSANAIDKFGDVVGNAGYGMLWPRKGDPIQIPAPRGKSAVIPLGINEAKLVTGYYYDARVPRCFTWTPEGGSMDLDYGAGKHIASCHAQGINQRGEIAGTANDGKATRAFVYRHDHIHLLPLLKGTDYCEGSAINDSGDILGVCNAQGSGAEYGRPVLWHDGKPKDISPAGDGIDFIVGSMNNVGVIVGNLSTTCCEQYKPAVYTPEAGWQLLNDLIPDPANWIVTSATGVNDDGVVSGMGTNAWNYDVVIELVPQLAAKPHIPGDMQ